MVKVSVNRFVLTRVETIRKEFDADTQRLRKKNIDKLEGIFKVAAKVARGNVGHQRIDGKLVRIELNQRKRWLRVAMRVTLIISSIASNIDEKETRVKLDELERLVNDVLDSGQLQHEQSSR